MEINSATISVIIGLIFVTIFVYLFRKKYSYWEDRGVPQCKPEFFYGNFRGVGKSRPMSDPLNQAYRIFKGKSPIAGIYMMLSPAAVVCDLNLAKNVLIRDFQNFVNRGTYNNARDDPLSAHLFSVDDCEWRSLRQKLTSTFTSGKMKFMFPSVVSVAERLVEVFHNSVKQSSHVEIKDLMYRYTLDVIGTCVFGIECNSLKDPSSEFTVMAKQSVYRKNHGAFWENFMFFFPKYARYFRLRRTPKDIEDFYRRVVRETVEYREKNNVQRNDFMNVLIDLKNKKSFQDEDVNGGLTLLEMTAQAFVFFGAGFETSSNLMGYVLYEMAQHQNIQDRVRKEINETLRKYGNKFTYECLGDMKYFQMVVNETLRKYPVISLLVRVAMCDYAVPGTEIVIEKGTKVFIPIQAIQNDPDIYPNPDDFNPERFSVNEVDKRHPMAWLPFGDGPRNCIGLRFGNMQSMIGLLLLLNQFRVSVCPQTDIPLNFGNLNIILYHDGAIVLQAEEL